jgi:hypothetical protein
MGSRQGLAQAGFRFSGRRWRFVKTTGRPLPPPNPLQLPAFFHDFRNPLRRELHDAMHVNKVIVAGGGVGVAPLRDGLGCKMFEVLCFWCGVVFKNTARNALLNKTDDKCTARTPIPRQMLDSTND